MQQRGTSPPTLFAKLPQFSLIECTVCCDWFRRWVRSQFLLPIFNLEILPIIYSFSPLPTPSPLFIAQPPFVSVRHNARWVYCLFLLCIVLVQMLTTRSRNSIFSISLLCLSQHPINKVSTISWCIIDQIMSLSILIPYLLLQNQQDINDNKINAGGGQHRLPRIICHPFGGTASHLPTHREGVSKTNNII